jgi:peptidoglycan/LPS O-acetylase OafA/YrhL
MRYNPALDGLRAVAILLVLADHSRFLPGGLIGVDVFFVISGYLITSILLAELRQTGEISLPNFYYRRALRLLPALGILAAFEMIRSLFHSDGYLIRNGVWIAISYLQNFNSVMNFVPAKGLMGHTWSLATEEQFYMFWPIVLPFLLKRRALIWIGSAAALMVAARFLPLEYTRPWLDFSPGLRPVGLLIGCALAFIPRIDFKAPVWLFLGVLVSVAVFEESFVLTAPLAASLATAAIIAGSRGTSILTYAPLRYVGKISYGLFLYASPILEIGRKWTQEPVWMLALLGLGFGVAAISYEFIEKPCLRLKDRIGERRAIPVGVAAE